MYSVPFDFEPWDRDRRVQKRPHQNHRQCDFLTLRSPLPVEITTISVEWGYKWADKFANLIEVQKRKYFIRNSPLKSLLFPLLPHV